jgi:hypothetical protein
MALSIVRGLTEYTKVGHPETGRHLLASCAGHYAVCEEGEHCVERNTQPVHALLETDRSCVSANSINRLGYVAET